MTTTTEILTAVIAEDASGRSIAERLCHSCASALPITGVGLALMNDAGHQGVIATTDGVARVMEDLQFTLGEGPCVDASRQRRPVLQPDLSSTACRTWPRFGPAVLAAGISAIFSFPLQVGAIRLGILDLYRETPGILTAAELAEALAYADAAVVVLLNLQDQMEPGRGLHPQLGDPVQHHAEVHQATGVIAVQAAVGLTEALLLLRSHAYAANRPILAVAKEVLSGALRFHLDGRDDQ
ncbi:GAF and ANTAR domain-containing protein [Nocardioides sp.]|uniref:GAF and ANTAR domain-containing protein n=1 Tax=Nocardioides sp. TaxID=35761 RepID=UPI003D0BD34C